VRPVKWTELRDLCDAEGCSFDRQRGDHYIMTKKGIARPVVIPMKRDLKEDIVLGVGRTLGLSRQDILDRLNPRSGKKAAAK
jgi:predicted RNA binding protein YcfA (HicA-like mRNA interferase family)